MADDLPNDDELETLEEHIVAARAHAAEAVDAFADVPTETFVDGESDDDGLDDQTVAPPG